MKTLIVDDSALSRKVLRQTLLACGIGEDALREAEDGMQALAMLTREPSDLLFCDLHMPRMDGRSLLACLRRAGALDRLRVVVLSSEAHRLTPAELAAYSIAGVARKPVKPEEIQAMIEHLASGGTCRG